MGTTGMTGRNGGVETGTRAERALRKAQVAERLARQRWQESLRILETLRREIRELGRIERLAAVKGRRAAGGAWDAASARWLEELRAAERVQATRVERLRARAELGRVARERAEGRGRMPMAQAVALAILGASSQAA